MWFLSGLMIGGLFGIVLICLLKGGNDEKE